MKTSLERMGVNTEGIRISRTEQTGVALITLDSSAENSIVVCPGANGTVDSDEILAALEALPVLKMIMLQLEIPMDCVERTRRICRAARNPGLSGSCPGSSGGTSGGTLCEADLHCAEFHRSGAAHRHPRL